MLHERLYIPFKWALFLSFADVMCFFISVYLLIRVSEKCQNILFLLLKRRKRLDFHRYGIPSNFSFPKLLFIESHTIISEVCFKNIEFHSSILGVIFGVIFTILGVILYFLSVILCLLSVILGVTLTVFLGFTQSFRVHIIVLIIINPNLNHLSLTIKYVLR